MIHNTDPLIRYY